MYSQLLKILSGQALLGVVGLLCLPLIARGLGSELYGDFSLFVIIMGIIFVFDFTRVLAVKRLSLDSVESSESSESVNIYLSALSFINSFFLLFIGFGLAWLLLDINYAIPLALIGFFQSMSSPYYASMSCQGKVGNANLIRNVFWAIAYLLSAYAVNNKELSNLFPWTFLIANIVIYYIYKQLDTVNIRIVKLIEMLLVIKTSWRDIANLCLFNFSGGILTATDKSLVKEHEPEVVFGQYTAQADIALKMNMLSQALSAVLFPMLTSHYNKDGISETVKFFAKNFILATLTYFFLIYPCIIWSYEIIIFLFGKEFLSTNNYFAFFLVGVYANLLGFLIVPLQRAMNNFNESRTAYLKAAALIVLCGLITVPIYGVLGALAIYFIPRLFDIYMLLKLVKNNPEVKLLKLSAIVFLSGLVILVWSALELFRW